VALQSDTASLVSAADSRDYQIQVAVPELAPTSFSSARVETAVSYTHLDVYKRQEPHCSHRGTSLEFGRIEEGGIRCCYHGWLYDTQGHVIEMPCEREGFCQKRDFWHPSYRTMEFGGLVFVYMGPPDVQPPLLPMFDIIDTRHRHDVVLVGKRLWDDHAIGYVRDCNWLQHFENSADPYLSLIHI